MAYISKYSGEEIDNSINSIPEIQEVISSLQNEINALKNVNYLDKFYPIGSIYTSSQSTSPATLFGGTWTQIKDTFLLTAGDNYSAGSIGGSATTALTVENMPSHTHTFTGSSATTSSSGAHTHTPSNANYHFQWMQSTSSDATLHLQVSKGSGYYVNGGNPSASDAIDSYGGIHHGANTNSAGAHTHTLTAKGTNSSVGSGEAFNNLPPYKVVYAWERTA